MPTPPPPHHHPYAMTGNVSDTTVPFDQVVVGQHRGSGDCAVGPPPLWTIIIHCMPGSHCFGIMFLSTEFHRHSPAVALWVGVISFSGAVPPLQGRP